MAYKWELLTTYIHRDDPPSKNMNTRTIHVWNIYLHLPWKSTSHVGKYTIVPWMVRDMFQAAFQICLWKTRTCHGWSTHPHVRYPYENKSLDKALLREQLWSLFVMGVPYMGVGWPAMNLGPWILQNGNGIFRAPKNPIRSEWVWILAGGPRADRCKWGEITPISGLING